MFNPLVQDLSGLSDQELQSKFLDLNTRIVKASRLGKPEMINQLRAIAFSYQEEIASRQQKLLDNTESKRKDFKGLIDIN